MRTFNKTQFFSRLQSSPLSFLSGTWLMAAVISATSILGVVLLFFTSAAAPIIALESEIGATTAPAVAITDTTASGGKAVQFGSPPPAANNPYRPMKITDPKQLPHAPQDANYVMWNFPAGTMLHEAFQKLGANDILVLPERAQPYEIDSSKGFVSDSARYYEMARAKRGLVGMGPGVIVQPSASSFSLPRATGSDGNGYRIMATDTDNSYLGNFEMRGRSFGEAAYDSLAQYGNNAIWERIYFNGAHRGWKNSPPGETGAIHGWRGTNQQVYNVEIDCRDPVTGARVGTSPFMFNAQSNVVVQDVYAHHAYSGMPTFWKVTNVTTTRLRSEHNGSGSGELNGSGINHEIVAGTVTHNDPTLIIDYRSPANTGLHISIGNAAGANYVINRPVVDVGPAGAGVLTAQIWGSNPPADSQFRVTNTTGGAFPFRSYR